MTITNEGTKLFINGYVFKEYEHPFQATDAAMLLNGLLASTSFTFIESATKSQNETLYTATLSLSCTKSSSQQPQLVTD